MLPKATSIIIVESELEAVEAWASRHGARLMWQADALELRVRLTQPSTGLAFYLRGRFDNYREVPPAWTFCDPTWENTSKECFPARSQTPFGSSILHNKPVICAPFNRLAYAEHGGPHGNWGGPAQWITPKDQYVYADSIGDMLQVIQRDVNYSEGHMSS